MEHTLNLTINTHADTDTFDVLITAPECGDVTELNGLSYKAKDREQFDIKVGREIYSWISLWMDAEYDPVKHYFEYSKAFWMRNGDSAGVATSKAFWWDCIEVWNADNSWDDAKRKFAKEFRNYTPGDPMPEAKLIAHGGV